MGTLYSRQMTPYQLRAAIAQDLPAANVQQYGADRGGTYTSINAFNAAYNAAMAATPHLPIYVPSGKYLLPSPGLSWTNQNDIAIVGDGPNMTTLLPSGSNYTMLTISADTGGGTTGTNLRAGNLGMGIVGSLGTGVNALSIADYFGFSLENLQLYSSGNSLKMAGMAVGDCSNLNCLTAGTNSAGNSALTMVPDTAAVACGPINFSGGNVNGQSNVTQGGGINSNGSFGITFTGTLITAFGPSLTTIGEFSNGDDITLINCYSESGCNTTGNTADMFYLGRTSACINFTVIGGHYFNGFGGHNCNRAIVENNGGPTVLINPTFANFASQAFAAGLAGLDLLAVNVSAPGGGAKVFNAAGFPTGSFVQFFKYPGTTAGFGTPTGTGVILNFPGATATLAQCSQAIAQIIADRIKEGFYNA